MSSEPISSPEPTFEVVWPLGKCVSEAVTPAPALSDLNGKTVGELWDGVFRGDQVFPILNDELRKKVPRIKIIDHKTLGTTFGNVPGYIEKLPGLLKQHGCDAVISAVGA
jgi:hypothetical protein